VFYVYEANVAAGADTAAANAGIMYFEFAHSLK